MHGHLLMVEVLLVLCAVVAIGLIGVTTTIITPQMMTEVGLWLLLCGLVTGIPTGLWYHVLLYRALTPKIQLPPSWWTSPVQFHSHLTPEDIARIKPWFTIGGVGFLLSLAGGLAAMVGLLLSG
jgi:hypothetical protein